LFTLTTIDIQREAEGALSEAAGNARANGQIVGGAGPGAGGGSGEVRLARLRVWLTVICHGVVDYFSYLIVPLMPLLVTRLHLDDAQKAWILGAGSVASGLIQPAVAWVSDKLNTRWFGTLGLVLAAVATCAIGLAETFPQLLLIQVLSSIGIGAFHPVAAAAVGQLSGRRRSLGVSLFFLGGMAGGISGNTTATPYATAFGLHGFLYLIAPSIACAGVLIWAIHGVAHQHHDAHETHAELPERERRWRWASVWILYVGNVIRFTVNAALVYLVINWSMRLIATRQGANWETLDAEAKNQFGLAASGVNGWLQASMQVGMGVAGLALARLVRAGRERPLLIWMPVLGALPLFVIPWAMRAFEGTGAGSHPAWTVPIVFALIVVAGIGFGGIVPVTIALAQRMLPHRTSLASGLMMGGAWFVAFMGPVLGKWFSSSKWLAQWFGDGAAWHATGGMLLAAGVISLAIPGWLVRRVAQQ